MRTIYDVSVSRRVCFSKNSDGTFCFLEWKFSAEDDSWLPTRVGIGSRLSALEDAVREAMGRVDWLKAVCERMIYQLGWTALPGLRGIGCSGFRATPTTAPDNEHGVAIAFVSDSERDEFLRQAEEHFATRRFSNSADAFDTVKAYALEHAAKR